MKIKKFTAASMQEAAKQIKKELGNDAVILNSKQVKKRKWLGLRAEQAVEVIAVLDRESREAKKIPPHAGEGKKKAEMTDTVQTFQPQQQARKFDLSHYKEVLPEPLKKAERLLDRTGLTDQMQKTVLSELLHSSIAAGDLTEENVTFKLQELLAEKLPSKDRWQEGIQSKYVVLFGSTGAGKTTTLAKLAASTMLEEHKKIAFITTDTYRIAAVEQLKTYAELLQAPLEVCYSKEECLEAQTKFAEYDHVFIDTAGRNFKEEQYITELQEMIPFESGLQSFLVLSASAKYEDMKQVLSRFSDIPVNQFIFTKTDETASLGSVYQVLTESMIGAAFLTNGQNVPEDILSVSPKDFVRMLME
ncbi:flagellar biosynthesis protein FlhF [Bacillus nakamurai]|uniref:flagellar biosynthesis protein FlhF n=1 Tax=Bacillus nakamurai TaxID=1793963 RepID=UPI001E5261F0|nr:flagellar biosynthesis protein FlhF [Bacillus nakamurai]MCC9020790.1 flagellar biosynthesis protein FlhF [Bacillus nakamurai]